MKPSCSQCEFYDKIKNYKYEISKKDIAIKCNYYKKPEWRKMRFEYKKESKE